MFCLDLNWLVVTGTWLDDMTFHIGMSSSQPTFTPSFFRGVGRFPTTKQFKYVFPSDRNVALRNDFIFGPSSGTVSYWRLWLFWQPCMAWDSPAHWSLGKRWILWRFMWWFVVAFYGDILGIKRDIAKNSSLTWSNCLTENVGKPHTNSTLWNLMVPIWNAINWRVYHVCRTADLRGSSNRGEFQIFWAESCWISEFPTVENLVFLIKSLCNFWGGPF